MINVGKQALLRWYRNQTEGQRIEAPTSKASWNRGTHAAQSTLAIEGITTKIYFNTLQEQFRWCSFWGVELHKTSHVKQWSQKYFLKEH